MMGWSLLGVCGVSYMDDGVVFTGCVWCILYGSWGGLYWVCVVYLIWMMGWSLLGVCGVSYMDDGVVFAGCVWCILYG